MRKGICPKCGSTEIYHFCMPHVGGGLGWERYLNIKVQWGEKATLNWDTFLCTNCGYFENYLNDRELLESVKNPENQWVKVNQ